MGGVSKGWGWCKLNGGTVDPCLKNDHFFVLAHSFP